MERLLTMLEVSEITRTPVETLRFWRARGRGPQGFKFEGGKRVLYAESEVERWMREAMKPASK